MVFSGFLFSTTVCFKMKKSFPWMFVPFVSVLFNLIPLIPSPQSSFATSLSLLCLYWFTPAVFTFFFLKELLWIKSIKEIALKPKNQDILTDIFNISKYNISLCWVWWIVLARSEKKSCDYLKYWLLKENFNTLFITTYSEIFLKPIQSHS